MNIETTCNTPDEILFQNIRINSQRDIPWLKQSEAHDGHAVIVGGGPSISDWIEEIRMRQQNGQVIFALNGAAKWLTKNGIHPDFCVIIDARDINIEFMGYANHHLLASQCHPKLFEQDAKITLWHQEYPENMQEFDSCLPEGYPEHALIGGGTTVGLSALALVYAMGYRFMHLYGYDSSYSEENLHAYSQTDPQRIDCISTVAGRSFRTTLAMAKQAELFPQLSDSLIDLGCTITIRGDGLLPWTSKMSAVRNEQMSEQEKYNKMWEFDSYRTYSPGECVVDDFISMFRPKGLVIDFGCGTGRAGVKLEEAGCDVTLMDFTVNSRDSKAKDLPFIQHDLTQPIPINFVAKYGYCTDVMEHIEPENVGKVIQNIMNACENCFFQISTVPDRMGSLIGQDLHLTVKPLEWWEDLIISLGYAVLWRKKEAAAALFFVTQPLEEENA